MFFPVNNGSDKTQGGVDIPAATSRNAGVMTPQMAEMLGKVNILKGSFTAFQLNTTTVNLVGDAAFVDLGPSNVSNGWCISTISNAHSTSLGFRCGTVRILVVSDGLGVVALDNIEEIDTPYSSGFVGDEGKVTPGVSIVNNRVRLTFTPVGEANETVYYGINGVVSSSRVL